MTDAPERRARRQFTDEFKTGAFRLVLDEGPTVGTVACDMDLTDTAVRDWVKRAQAEPHARPHRPDDRRARDTRTAPQRSARSSA